MFFICYYCNTKKKLINCNNCKKIVCNECKTFAFHKNANNCIFCKKILIRKTLIRKKIIGSLD